MATITVGGVALPEPTQLNSGDEIIWSSNAGRSPETGRMLGDVITQKKTLEIKWEYITESEAALIKSRLAAGFFPITFRDFGQNLTIDAYRGSLSKEHLGYIGDGVYYYKSVSVSLIQQ